MVVNLQPFVTERAIGVIKLSLLQLQLQMKLPFDGKEKSNYLSRSLYKQLSPAPATTSRNSKARLNFIHLKNTVTDAIIIIIIDLKNTPQIGAAVSILIKLNCNSK